MTASELKIAGSVKGTLTVIIKVKPVLTNYISNQNIRILM